MTRSLLVALAATLVLAAPAAASPPVFEPGSDGLGDPFFPLAGNGGYDVQHYDLGLAYDRGSNQLDGDVRIRAQATQNLSSFNLDFRGYEISDLEVSGRDAAFTRDGQELTVTPARGIHRNATFIVDVEYSGTPEPVVDPDDSLEGWVPTDDGAFVVNEPQGSPGWYPANDNPQDKATYSFSITVPEGITAIANGRLISNETIDGKTTWRWREDSPMAPYLATATNGVFELRITEAGDIPLYQAVDPKVRNPTLSWERISAEAEIIEFFSGLYGEYPFSTGGGVVDNGGVGYALESQTKSMYDVQGSSTGAPGASTVVHEVSHQWFGNAVTNAVWPDIWLNEGFARFSEWIYAENHGGISAHQAMLNSYNLRPATSSFWLRPPAALPGPEVMFSSQPYDRGGMTLQNLRETIGDDDFFTLLRTWYETYKYGNATTADFIALAEQVSGEELSAFFDDWLYQPNRPALATP